MIEKILFYTQDDLTYKEFYFNFSPELGVESIVYFSTICSIIGAWLGAFPIPLDWDRPWQVNIVHKR